MNEKSPQDTPADDPYLWLEEIEGARALEWVRARNAESLKVLEGDPRFAPIHADARAIHTADDRIPYGQPRAGTVHGFWRDRDHVRGLLRRTSLASYRAPKTAWEVVLDLDALAVAEGENWVYAGRAFLPPDRSRCLVFLSRGGGDAVVMREFDLATKAFVDDGFALPEAKQSAAWLDPDTLLVQTGNGGGPLNTAGYPRTVRLWRRGTPIADAPLVYEAPETDALLGSHVEHRPDGTHAFILRRPDFFHEQVFLVDRDGQATPCPCRTTSTSAGSSPAGCWRCCGRPGPSTARTCRPARRSRSTSPRRWLQRRRGPCG
ncbi:MAG: hypothetical protein R3F55_15890 [Alphaproteobacteria bacterium]